MMSREESTQDHMTMANPEQPERGIDVFAVIIALLSEWRIGFATFVVVALVCLGFILLLKPQYVATAVLLPQEGHTDTTGLASLFSNHGPGQLYMGLLQSRSVQDNVIERANLLQLFHASSMESARDILNSKSGFAVGVDTLVTISIRDGNAQDAAKIANGYLDALQNLNDSMALQQGTQTAQYFGQQLDLEREKLIKAEQKLAQTQKQTGLVAPDTQTQIGLSAIAATRAQISSRQEQLTALLQSETEQNPQVVTLRSQIAQLEAQERQMEGTSGGSRVGAALPAGQMPDNNLDILRAQREVKYHDTLVTSLSNQFETARLNEAFARSAFQVVDRAVVPERKAWPPRKPFFAASLVFGIVMGIVAILGKLTWRRVTADPEHRAQLAQLRKAFGSG
jgi:tyrosine-protein kinase Etk/Wzc